MRDFEGGDIHRAAYKKLMRHTNHKKPKAADVGTGFLEKMGRVVGDIAGEGLEAVGKAGSYVKKQTTPPSPDKQMKTYHKKSNSIPKQMHKNPYMEED